MDDKNSKKKVNLELIINNAQLSTAKRKLEENRNYEFRFKIVRNNRDKGITETKLSKRVPLKESLMFFDENKVIFTDIDQVNDVIEIYPLIGGPTDKGKKYDATFKYVKDFKLNEKIEELWILKNPPNSFIKLKIFMFSDSISPNDSSIKKDFFKLHSLPNTYEVDNLISPNTKLNTAKIELNYKNSDILTRLTGDNTVNSQQDSTINKNDEEDCKSLDFKQIFDSKQQQTEDNPNTTTRVHRDLIKMNSILPKQGNFNHFLSPTKSNQSLPVMIDRKPPIYTNISYNDNINTNLSQLPTKKCSSEKNNPELMISHPNSLNVKASIGIEHPNSININASIGIQHPNNLNFPSNVGIHHTNTILFAQTNPFKSNHQISHENFATSNLKILENEEMTIDDNEDFIPDSFCEAFFGVSIPSIDPKLIHDSDKFTAPCGHLNCSMFDAYKPDIVFRYPLKDHNKVEINSIIASLCFPKGIKLCFSPNDKKLKPLNNFLIVNTNEVGTRYYIMTYHFYIKYSLQKFNDKYKINPTKDFLNLEKENKELELYSNNPAKQKIITENIEKKLKMCSDFFFNDYIYLPICICLLSRFPYAKQMEKCLESILKLSSDEKYNTEDINKLILHLTREIPIPPPNKRLMFFVPYSISPIEICGILYKNLPILNYHLKILIDLFSIENIILIHHLMLCESKILFIGDNFSLLTEVIEGYVALLYPLQWTYPYIPILSEELIKYLQTPLPYIMGIDISMINLAMDYLNEEEDIFLVYINKNTVSKFSRKEKKFSTKQLLKNLTPFPEDNEKEITINLKEIRKVLTDKKNQEFNMNVVDKKIRQVFSRSMVRLFGDYGKYLSYVDGVPLFNKESYLINHSIKDRVFFERIADSQHFNYFLQYDIKEVFPYFHKLCLRYSNTLKMKTFEKRSNSLSKMNVTKTDKNRSSNGGQIKTNAIIRNSSFNDNNSENNSNNSLSTIHDNKSNDFLENFLITPYFISEYILKSNLYKIEEILTLRYKDNPFFVNEINRVIESLKEFDMKSIGGEYKRYIIPEYKLLHKDIFTKKLEIRSSTSINNNYLSNNTNLENKNKQQYDTIINDHLRQILTSKKLSATQKKTVLGILKNKDARKLFGKMMFQKKFLELKSLCLSDTSFLDLYDLTFNCLLECNNGSYDESEFEEVRLITKSQFFYYKVDGNKKQKFLYQEIIKQNGTFNIWKNQRFWEKWFELDVDEVENFYSNRDIFYFNILISLSKMMFDIKIELLFISNCIDNIAKAKLDDKTMVQELQIVIKKQYNTAKR